MKRMNHDVFNSTASKNLDCVIYSQLDAAKLQYWNFSIIIKGVGLLEVGAIILLLRLREQMILLLQLRLRNEWWRCLQLPPEKSRKVEAKWLRSKINLITLWSMFFPLKTCFFHYHVSNMFFLLKTYFFLRSLWLFQLANMLFYDLPPWRQKTGLEVAPSLRSAIKNFAPPPPPVPGGWVPLEALLQHPWKKLYWFKCKYNSFIVHVLFSR